MKARRIISWTLVLFIFAASGVIDKTALAKDVPAYIAVGVDAGLTGQFGSFGQGALFGIKAAVSDINRQGGVFVKEYRKKLPIKLFIVDNQSEQSRAGTLAQYLILNDKVKFIVNGMDPPFIRASIAQICDRYRVVQVTGVGPYEAWMALQKSAGKPWRYTWASSFAIATPAPAGDFRHGKPGYCMMDSYLAMMAKLNNKTNKHVAAFASDEPDGRGWYLSFAPVMEKKGFTVYGAKKEFGLVPPETTDFSSLILAWKKADCQILWANSSGPFFGAMWRQARRMNFKPKMVFATRAGIFYTDVKNWGADLADGVCNEMFWNPEIQDSPGIGSTTPESLYRQWRKATGQGLNQNVGMGYANTQVVIDAIERAGSLDPDTINQALQATDLMTIYNRVKFDPDHFSRIPVAFGQWRKTNKPYVWEDPVIISYHKFMPATAKMIFPMPY